MGNALASLNNSLKRFIANPYGLSEDCVYTPKSTGVALDTTIVRQEEDNKSSHGVIAQETITSQEIFLISLPYEPVKNDQIEWNSQVYFVDYHEIVTPETFRIYTIAEAQTTAQATPTSFSI